MCSLPPRFLVRVSYLEIYNEEVRDLLGKDQMQRLEVSNGGQKSPKSKKKSLWWEADTETQFSLHTCTLSLIFCDYSEV